MGNCCIKENMIEEGINNLREIPLQHSTFESNCFDENNHNPIELSLNKSKGLNTLEI